MKQFLSTILLLSLLLSLIACGNKNETFENVKSKTKTFEAKILDIQNNYYLVKPLDKTEEYKTFEEILVPIAHINSSKEPQKDDIIEITYYGIVLEQDFTKINKVYNIKVIE